MCDDKPQVSVMSFDLNSEVCEYGPQHSTPVKDAFFHKTPGISLFGGGVRPAATTDIGVDKFYECHDPASSSSSHCTNPGRFSLLSVILAELDGPESVVDISKISVVDETADNRFDFLPSPDMDTVDGVEDNNDTLSRSEFRGIDILDRFGGNNDTVSRSKFREMDILNIIDDNNDTVSKLEFRKMDILSIAEDSKDTQNESEVRGINILDRLQNSNDTNPQSEIRERDTFGTAEHNNDAKSEFRLEIRAEQALVKQDNNLLCLGLDKSDTLGLEKPNDTCELYVGSHNKNDTLGLEKPSDVHEPSYGGCHDKNDTLGLENPSDVHELHLGFSDKNDTLQLEKPSSIYELSYGGSHDKKNTSKLEKPSDVCKQFYVGKNSILGLENPSNVYRLFYHGSCNKNDTFRLEKSSDIHELYGGSSKKNDTLHLEKPSDVCELSCVGSHFSTSLLPECNSGSDLSKISMTSKTVFQQVESSEMSVDGVPLSPTTQKMVKFYHKMRSKSASRTLDVNVCNSRDCMPPVYSITELRRTPAAYIEQDIINKQRQEIQLLMEELGNRDQELNDLVLSHQKQVKVWESDTSKLAALQARLSQYEDELKIREDQLKDTLIEMSRVNEQREVDGLELKRTQDEMMKLADRIQENSLYIKEMETQNQKLSNSLREFITSRQAFIVRDQELLSVIQDKDCQLLEKQQEIEKLTEQMKYLEFQCEESDQRNNNIAIESMNWKKKYHQVKDESDKLQEEIKSKEDNIQKMTQQLHESLQQAIALQKALFTSCEREKCKEEVMYSLRKQHKRTMQELQNIRELYDRLNHDTTLYHLSVKDKNISRDEKRKVEETVETKVKRGRTDERYEDEGEKRRQDDKKKYDINMSSYKLKSVEADQSFLVKERKIQEDRGSPLKDNMKHEDRNSGRNGEKMAAKSREKSTGRNAERNKDSKGKTDVVEVGDGASQLRKIPLKHLQSTGPKIVNDESPTPPQTLFKSIGHTTMCRNVATITSSTTLFSNGINFPRNRSGFLTKTQRTESNYAQIPSVNKANMSKNAEHRSSRSMSHSYPHSAAEAPAGKPTRSRTTSPLHGRSKAMSPLNGRSRATAPPHGKPPGLGKSLKRIDEREGGDDSFSDASHVPSPSRFDDELTPADSDGMCHELKRDISHLGSEHVIRRSPDTKRRGSKTPSSVVASRNSSFLKKTQREKMTSCTTDNHATSASRSNFRNRAVDFDHNEDLSRSLSMETQSQSVGTATPLTNEKRNVFAEQESPVGHYKAQTQHRTECENRNIYPERNKEKAVSEKVDSPNHRNYSSSKRYTQENDKHPQVGKGLQQPIIHNKADCQRLRFDNVDKKSVAQNTPELSITVSKNFCSNCRSRSMRSCSCGLTEIQPAFKEKPLNNSMPDPSRFGGMSTQHQNLNIASAEMSFNEIDCLLDYNSSLSKSLSQSFGKDRPTLNSQQSDDLQYKCPNQNSFCTNQNHAGVTMPSNSYKSSEVPERMSAFAGRHDPDRREHCYNNNSRSIDSLSDSDNGSSHQGLDDLFTGDLLHHDNGHNERHKHSITEDLLYHDCSLNEKEKQSIIADLTYHDSCLNETQKLSVDGVLVHYDRGHNESEKHLIPGDKAHRDSGLNEKKQHFISGDLTHQDSGLNENPKHSIIWDMAHQDSGHNEKQKHSITGDMALRDGDLNEEKQHSITEDLTHRDSGLNEKQKHSITGDLPHYNSSLNENQKHLITGDLVQRDSSLSESQKQSITGDFKHSTNRDLAHNGSTLNESQKHLITGDLPHYHSGLNEKQKHFITGDLPHYSSGLNENQKHLVTGDLVQHDSDLNEKQKHSIPGDLTHQDNGFNEKQKHSITGDLVHHNIYHNESRKHVVTEDLAYCNVSLNKNHEHFRIRQLANCDTSLNEKRKHSITGDMPHGDICCYEKHKHLITGDLAHCDGSLDENHRDSFTRQLAKCDTSLNEKHKQSINGDIASHESHKHLIAGDFGDCESGLIESHKHSINEMVHCDISLNESHQLFSTGGLTHDNSQLNENYKLSNNRDLALDDSRLNGKLSTNIVNNDGQLNEDQFFSTGGMVHNNSSLNESHWLSKNRDVAQDERRLNHKPSTNRGLAHDDSRLNESNKLSTNRDFACHDSGLHDTYYLGKSADISDSNERLTFEGQNNVNGNDYTNIKTGITGKNFAHDSYFRPEESDSDDETERNYDPKQSFPKENKELPFFQASSSSMTSKFPPSTSLKEPSLYMRLSKIHFSEKTRRYEWVTEPDSALVNCGESGRHAADQERMDCRFSKPDHVAASDKVQTSRNEKLCTSGDMSLSRFDSNASDSGHFSNSRGSHSVLSHNTIPESYRNSRPNSSFISRSDQSEAMYHIHQEKVEKQRSKYSSISRHDQSDAMYHNHQDMAEKQTAAVKNMNMKQIKDLGDKNNSNSREDPYLENSNCSSSQIFSTLPIFSAPIEKGDPLIKRLNFSNITLDENEVTPQFLDLGNIMFDENETIPSGLETSNHHHPVIYDNDEGKILVRDIAKLPSNNAQTIKSTANNRNKTAGGQDRVLFENKVNIFCNERNLIETGRIYAETEQASTEKKWKVLDSLTDKTGCVHTQVTVGNKSQNLPDCHFQSVSETSKPDCHFQSVSETSNWQIDSDDEITAEELFSEIEGRARFFHAEKEQPNLNNVNSTACENAKMIPGARNFCNNQISSASSFHSNHPEPSEANDCCLQSLNRDTQQPEKEREDICVRKQFDPGTLVDVKKRQQRQTFRTSSSDLSCIQHPDPTFIKQPEGRSYTVSTVNQCMPAWAHDKTLEEVSGQFEDTLSSFLQDFTE